MIHLDYLIEIIFKLFLFNIVYLGELCILVLGAGEFCMCLLSLISLCIIQVLHSLIDLLFGFFIIESGILKSAVVMVTVSISPPNFVNYFLYIFGSPLLGLYMLIIINPS
jgi:hypothetical protein